MSNKRILINFLGGLAVGICLSVTTGFALFYSRSVHIFQSSSIPTAQAADPLELSTQKPTPTQTDLLDEAEAALSSGHPEKVRELLYPMIESWTSNDDLIRGYRLLGEAELAQGHPQLAVPYFEKLYFYEPTAENLFMLATVYDAGGDIRNALEKYQELARWEDLPPEVDIELLNFRIQNISHALGTPVATETTLPE
jgi:tetratricopeptide (TPR) repeat protein